MLVQLASTLLSAGVLLFAGAVVYFTCAPLRPSAAPTHAKKGRSPTTRSSLLSSAARRYLAGIGWGVFAGLVLITAVYLLLALPR
jgi:hypothetical protein